MPKILLHLFLAYHFCTAGVAFQREAITATITACDTLEIQGIYFFVNSDTSIMSIGIDYPFPVDSTSEYPHYIAVVRLASNQPIEYIKRQMGISWSQSIPARTTDSIKVIYRQKIKQANGCYILSTTQNWKRPLEQAAFTVITPSNITLSYWSFQSDSVSINNGRIYYYSQKKNFFPERDMLLEWHCE